jgi:hypothetical protein
MSRRPALPARHRHDDPLQLELPQRLYGRPHSCPGRQTVVDQDPNVTAMRPNAEFYTMGLAWHDQGIVLGFG